VSTTVTNYISNIDTTFPSPGKDNATQTFRSNSSNIVGALTSLNADVSHLIAYSVDVTNTTTSFFGHTLQNVNLKNSSVAMIDLGTQAGDIVIDYSSGSYQKITLTTGLHNISFTGWPTNGKAAALKLSVVALAPNTTNLVFTNTLPLGPAQNPYVLYRANNHFEIQSEYSALDTTNRVFVRSLNEFIFDNTSVAGQISNSYISQYTGDAASNIVSRVSTVSGSNHAMLVTSNISGNPVAGLQALMPNIVKTTIVAGSTSNPQVGTANTFTVASVQDIMVGATFYLQTTSTQLTVSQIGSNNVITSTQSWPIGNGIGAGTVIFKNPTFRTWGEATAFPNIAYMSTNPANTTTGAINTFTGAIYAGANRLEVTFAEPNLGAVNTFAIDTITVATTSSDRSTKLANTNFVHQVLPYGAIILWSGAKTAIPSGWLLCDGTNNTPNLQDKFIVGAGNTYAVAATGGTANAVLLEHAHNVIEPGTPGDYGHQHAIQTYDGVTGTSGSITGKGTSGVAYSNQYTSKSETGVSVGTVTGQTAVASGAGLNLPPYYALCYIMKVTGA
jgi:hypothetical protein